MGEPIGALVTAAADISTMGDKVAAFAIAQNFLWTFQSLKGDLDRWVTRQLNWFLWGTALAAVIYASVEACLGWHAHDVIRASGYDREIEAQLLGTSTLLFVMRGLGVVASSAIVALAFLGTAQGESAPGALAG